MRPVFILLLLLGGNVVRAQDTLMAVYGSAVDILTKAPLKDLTVTSFGIQDTIALDTAVVAPDGSFMLGIFDPRDRILKFDVPGYVPRRILIDMEGPSSAQWKEGYGLSLEMSMYQQVDGLDLTMGHIPVGKSVYNAATDLFEWDRTYSRSINEQNKELLKTYKQKIGRP